MMVRLLCMILLLVMSGMALSVDKKYKYRYSFLNNFPVKKMQAGGVIIFQYSKNTCKQLSPAKGEGFPAGKKAIFKCLEPSYKSGFVFMAMYELCACVYACPANTTTDSMPINIKTSKQCKLSGGGCLLRSVEQCPM